MAAQETVHDAVRERMIENPVIKDRVTFVNTGEETNGEYLLAKLEVAPHGGNTMHYHVTFTERFEVVEGQLTVEIDGEQVVLEAGQTALVPRKARHRFFNASDEPVTCMVELRPARQFEATLRIAYGLARDGKVNARSLPTSIWHLALLFQMGESYVPGLPLFLQRGMFGLLAAIARLLGKDHELEKYL